MMDWISLIQHKNIYTSILEATFGSEYTSLVWPLKTGENVKLLWSSPKPTLTRCLYGEGDVGWL